MEKERLFREIEREIGFVFPADTVWEKQEKGLFVLRKGGVLRVGYTTARDILRAGLIAKANASVEEYAIREESAFEDVGLMIDCSRNAVRSVATVKKLIRNMAMLGYDALMLYTEDTYEVDGEPLFGYLRGRYAKAELKELDEYALALGIELIPCVQTLAHLGAVKRYYATEYKCFDCMDILEVGNERAARLIENIFATLAECFTSRRIHVGMDEAWCMGRGNYLNRNGYQPSFDVFCRHLQTVCGIAEKYGFQPIIWSDIFCTAIAEQTANAADKDGAIRELMKKVPQGLALCCWDYHGLTPEYFQDKLALHAKFNSPLWFAGGTIQDNRGFMPFLSYSMKICKAAITAARGQGVKKLLATVWGDNGGECALFATLPATAYYAYEARGISKRRFEREFAALTGYSLDGFMKLEYAQTFCGRCVEDIGNPAKYGLYSDPFSGYLDAVIRKEDAEYFLQAKAAVSRMRKGQYAYLFDTAYALNDVLSLKYALGIRLRSAYQAGDKEGLAQAAEDMKKIEKRLTALLAALRRQWHAENKPQGLEIQEIRLGGLKERLSGCRECLSDYLAGKVERIPELEEKLLPEAVGRRRAGNRVDEFSYMAIASVNVFDGYLDIDV